MKGIFVGRYRAFVRWACASYMRKRGFKVIHFLHIGKTGGTALGRVFRDNQRVGQYWFVLHEHSTTVKRLPKNDPFTFVLRDPVDRFVSAFYSRYRQGKPAYFIPWTVAEADAFALFPTANSLAEALSDSDPECRQSARSAMQAIGHVRTHYSDWLGTVDGLDTLRDRIPLVGWQPQLDSYLAGLIESLGGNAERYAFPKNDKQSHKGSHGGRGELSELAVQNLKNWYREDIQWIDAIRQLGLFGPQPPLGVGGDSEH